MDSLRIVIVDDQLMFRKNLKTVIEMCIEDAEVVGLAADGTEGLKVIYETNPNLVILDINMPGMNGIDCIKALRQNDNQVKVLMLTMFDEDQYMLESLQLGAVGYLLKDTEPEKFIEAIKMMGNDYVLLSQQVTKRLANEVLEKRGLPRDSYRDDLFRLTQREQEILKHIGLGEDNQEISRNLYLSEGTVRNYVSSIYEKLSLKDRAQAIRLAIRAGLTD